MGAAIKDRFDVVDDPGEAGFQTDPKTGKMLAADDSGAAGWLPLLRQRPRDRPFFLWLAALDPHRDYAENSIAAAAPAGGRDRAAAPARHAGGAA